MLKQRIFKYVLWSFVVIGSVGFIKARYTKTKVKSVSFELPKEMEELNKEAVIIKYGVHKTPWAVYTDHTGDVMLSINMDQDTVKYKKKKGVIGKDPKFERMFMKTSVYNTYENIKWEMDTIRFIDNKPMISFEFDGTLVGKDAKGNDAVTRNYNFIQYCFIKNKKYIINFACPYAEKSDWQPRARHIMNSLKISN